MKRRLAKELKDYNNNPPTQIRSLEIIDEKNGAKLKAIITGLEDSPFQGGLYEVEITLPPDQPFKPCKMKYLTEMFGLSQMCTSCSLDQWSPALTICKMIGTLRAYSQEENVKGEVDECHVQVDTYNIQKQDKNLQYTLAAWINWKYANGPQIVDMESFEKIFLVDKLDLRKDTKQIILDYLQNGNKLRVADFNPFRQSIIQYENKMMSFINKNIKK